MESKEQSMNMSHMSPFAKIPIDSILFSICRLLLKLIKPMVFEQGQRFTIRDGKTTLGTGVVTKVLPTLTPDERLELQEGKKAREKKAAGKVAAKK